MKAQLAVAPTFPAFTPDALRLENFERLIHREARKAYGRAQSAGLGLDYEDIFQEMAMTYCKAVKKFDPSKGFAFSTYLCSAMHKEINRFLEPLMLERNKHGVRSVEELSNGLDIEEEGHSLELIDRSSITEDKLERMQNVNQRIKRLSRQSAHVLMLLKRPTPELNIAFGAHCWGIQQEQVFAPNHRVPGDLTIAFIGGFLGYSRTLMRDVREELAWVAAAND